MSEPHTKLPKHRWYCRRGGRKLVRTKSQGNSASSIWQGCCPHGLTKLCLPNKTHAGSNYSTVKLGGKPIPQQLRAVGEGESVFSGGIAPGSLTTLQRMLPYLHTHEFSRRWNFQKETKKLKWQRGGNLEIWREEWSKSIYPCMKFSNSKFEILCILKNTSLCISLVRKTAIPSIKKAEKYLTNSSEAEERNMRWMIDIKSDLLKNSQICNPSQIEGGHNFSSR